MRIEFEDDERGFSRFPGKNISRLPKKYDKISQKIFRMTYFLGLGGFLNSLQKSVSWVRIPSLPERQTHQNGLDRYIPKMAKRQKKYCLMAHFSKLCVREYIFAALERASLKLKT